MIPQKFRAHRIRVDTAFTLTEILVTIAIFSLLAAFLVPSLGRMKKEAQRVKCMSNLRQIGAALQTYLGENNMTLPTCWVSLPFNPVVEPASDEHQPFSSYLARYLGFEGNDGDVAFLPVFQCPAWPEKVGREEAMKKDSPRLSNYRLVLGRTVDLSPFGGQEGRKKHRVTAVEGDFNLPPSRLPIVYNLDQQLPFVPATTDEVPKEPVFSSGRNVLFLDGHVGFEKGLNFLGDQFR